MFKATASPRRRCAINAHKFGGPTAPIAASTFERFRPKIPRHGQTYPVATPFFSSDGFCPPHSPWNPNFRRASGRSSMARTLPAGTVLILTRSRSSRKKNGMRSSRRCVRNLPITGGWRTANWSTTDTVGWLQQYPDALLMLVTIDPPARRVSKDRSSSCIRPRSHRWNCGSPVASPGSRFDRCRISRRGSRGCRP